MTAWRAAAVPSAATHDLRARVLRAGTPATEVRWPGDDDPSTVHLALVDDAGAVRGIASLFARPYAGEPHRPARQLRGMAVEPGDQGRGLGRALLDAAVAQARSEGAELVWANARDGALGFYERQGFVVQGEGFVSAELGLPHHVVVREL